MHTHHVPRFTFLLIDVLHERTRAIKKFLLDRHCYVHATATCAQAQKACSVLLFDAVLVAVDQPGTIEGAVADCIPGCTAQHIVALSAIDSPEARERAHALGASAFVQHEEHLSHVFDWLCIELDAPGVLSMS